MVLSRCTSGSRRSLARVSDISVRRPALTWPTANALVTGPPALLRRKVRYRCNSANQVGLNPFRTGSMRVRISLCNAGQALAWLHDVQIIVPVISNNSSNRIQHLTVLYRYQIPDSMFALFASAFTKGAIFMPSGRVPKLLVPSFLIPPFIIKLCISKPKDHLSTHGDLVNDLCQRLSRTGASSRPPWAAPESGRPV